MKYCSLLLALGLAFSPRAHAGYSVFCDQDPHLSAEQKNSLLLFSSAIKDQLEASGHRLAIVARAGINLDRFGLRYSHSGISLRASGNTPWSVRQLYYSCAENQPRLYDQGLSGFLIDQDNSRMPFVSLVFLPPVAERELETTALDRPLALRLLGKVYSANAYAYSTLYQNCNQWVMEVLAHAMGGLPAGGDLRAASQNWLLAHDYQPSKIQVSNPLLMAGAIVMPLLHVADHPQANLRRGVFRVSMPASVESFVMESTPGAERVEMCMNERQIVVHHGWDPIAAGCLPAGDDQILPLT